MSEITYAAYEPSGEIWGIYQAPKDSVGEKEEGRDWVLIPEGETICTTTHYVEPSTKERRLKETYAPRVDVDGLSVEITEIPAGVRMNVYDGSEYKGGVVSEGGPITLEMDSPGNYQLHFCGSPYAIDYRMELNIE